LAGKTGIGTGPNGQREQQKGPIPDLSLLVWDGRRVYIIYDTNVVSNFSVAAARNELAKELAGRGADIYFVDIPPEDGINGIDDFLAKHGPGPALHLFREARRFVPEAELVRFLCTDLGNEQAFELLYGNDFLYNFTAKQWNCWTGVIWQPDEIGAADRAMVDVACKRLRDVGLMPVTTEAEKKNKKQAVRGAIRLQSVGARQAALLSATTNPRFARRSEDFNTQPLLFACANGVLELDTGRFRTGLRSDMLTLATPVYWVPEARSERWLRFLNDIFPDRPEMVTFIKRAVGYSLTALTREEVFFILHGRSGRNGKGTFLRTLSAVLGTYATNTAFSTLIADRDHAKGPRNDIAALAGKRFVSAQESNEGVRFDEALIKSLTGGDLITARFLHQEFRTFAPTWKIWLSTNNPPEIRGTDGGIWSRPKLIPFTVSFKGREDRSLKDTLLDPNELSGILCWAAEGAREYLECGLEYPDEVVKATEDYKAESNMVARFVQECCVCADGLRAKARPLYQEFSRWAEGSGGMSETAFGRRLTDMGFQKTHTGRGTVYVGIAPMNANTESEP
jgi:putative DNA primase/helicase